MRVLTTDPATDPEHIAISKSKGIQVDWKDGHHSAYELRYLRHHCPCALCTGSHGTPPQAPPLVDPFPMFQAPLKMTSVEPAGNYAVQIMWNDGHSSGIYSWEHLRRICPCAECAKV